MYYIKWLSIFAGAALLFYMGLILGLKKGTRFGESNVGRTASITIHEILATVRPMIEEERKADFERLEKLVEESGHEAEANRRLGHILNGLGDVSPNSVPTPPSK